MNKIIKITSSAVLAGVFIAAASQALAIKPNGPAAENGLANPGTRHLELYEKDASWDPVDGGAWGRLTFADTFTFNGHGLEPDTGYTLIRYIDPWPGDVTCLAEGTSNPGGNINLSGDMPELDDSVAEKIWLVLGEDVDCDTDPVAFTDWNPGEYLFEYNTI